MLSGLFFLSHFPAGASQQAVNSRVSLLWIVGTLLPCSLYRRNRIYWIHPVNEKKGEAGRFNTLFENEKSLNFFRMSITTFDEIHNRSASEY